MASEGGEIQNSTNFNYLLEEFGMMVNTGQPYFTLANETNFDQMGLLKLHMRNTIILERLLFTTESLIANSIELPAKISSRSKTRVSPRTLKGRLSLSIRFGLLLSAFNFLYTYGATLNLQHPAIPLLSSGSLSYPMSRPICGVHINPVRFNYIFLRS